MNEAEAFSILSTFENLGAAKIKRLITSFGSAVQALQTPPATIAQLPGFKTAAAQWDGWEERNLWQRNLMLAARLNVRLVPYTASDFPKQLLRLPDHPALLYVQGSLPPPEKPCIAVIGTRQCSSEGYAFAETVSQKLANQGITIVSGLARGIDTAAHTGALAGGFTAAVIGSGLGSLYPPENLALGQAIAKTGALISEYPVEAGPERQHFPQRNRIVSGLASAVLLVEAPVKSGAMLTMERALKQERLLLVFSGFNQSEQFKGNHLWLNSGRALPVRNSNDILEAMQKVAAEN